MRTIDLDTLEIFRAVVAEGGVVRAATRLNRVQSNVTTRIRQLEARLGVALFRRQGRGLNLTAEGERLIAYAERLLSLADEAVAAVAGGDLRGRFRLGSLESTAGSRLPPLLSRYHTLYPQVVVDLSIAPTATLVAQVRRFEIDAAFVGEPFAADDLQALPIFEEELVLATPASVTSANATELGRRTILAFANGCSYRVRLEAWLASLDIRPERVLEFASYQAMVACVAAGTGVALVPRSVLAHVPAREQVTAHSLPPEIARNRTHLVWHAKAAPTLAALLALLPQAGDASKPLPA